MPANTNNTNLLAGVNELISAMNDLVAATTAQTLSVTVEASPIPPAPDVSINFDTAAIADAIDAQSDRLAPDGQSVYAGLGTLANRVAPDGQSMYELIALAGTANTHFANIADRLAPDGESIQPTIALLVNALDACLNKPTPTMVTMDTPTTETTYSAPNAVKCLAARRVVGQMENHIYFYKSHLIVAKGLATVAVGLTALVQPELLVLGISAFLTATVCDIIFTWYQVDVDNTYSEFLAIAEDLVEAIYSAASVADAITAMETVIDGQTWTKSDADDLIKLIIPTPFINHVFSDPTRLEPQYQSKIEFSEKPGVSDIDCSGFTLPIANDISAHNNYPTIPVDNTAILNAGAWVYSTHNNVHSWETGSIQTLYCGFVQLTTVTIEAVGDGQSIANFSIYPGYSDIVNGTPQVEREYLTNADLPFTFSAFGFFLQNPIGTPFIASFTLFDPGA